uniref:Putative molecular chaperone dnaj superfamily n=1 Tax=Panstrongylus megistus TaxID=65343 RepID=A0A069DRM9_9HEMI
MASLKEACELYFGTSDIYKILCLKKDATNEEVKKAYRKLSLTVHPDRVSDDEKEEATEKFKVLGKIHSVLSDTEKRAVYDDTGCLDDIDTADLQERDWYDYWRLLFKNVTTDDIDAYEMKYKGSETELEDLKDAYEKGQGDMDEILNRVPFTSPNDEPRLREILQKLIDNGELTSYKAFSNENPTKKRTRRRKYEQEAKRAKKVAEEMKKKNGPRKNDQEEDVDIDALKAIMLKKQEREAQAENFFKNLEEKYGGKGRKKTSRKAK